MQFLGVTEDSKKVILLRSWGGADLVKFMKTHAKVNFDTTPATDDTEAIPADSYKDTIDKTKKELQSLVNRTMAMHQLFTSKQGDTDWMNFIKDLEDKAHILNFNTAPYKQDDAVKDAAIFGMCDRKLKEKALAEDPDLTTLIRWGQSREAGREGAQDLQGTTSSISRVKENELDIPAINSMIEDLQVMKIRKQGKYSSRPSNRPRQQKKQSCGNCSSLHAQGRCPARGKNCFACKGQNHFEGAQNCPANELPPPAVNKITNKDEPLYSDTSMNNKWPGVRSTATTSDLQLITPVNQVANQANPSSSRHVHIDIAGFPTKLYADTGSLHTIIPPSSYRPEMGVVVAADTHLRAWGSKSNLDVKGMIKTTLRTKKGATTQTTIYIVDGYHPEPLLGDLDAEELGFIIFNKEGRDPHPDEAIQIQRIAQKLRDSLNISVDTVGSVLDEIPNEELKKVEALIDRFDGLVFSDDRIGHVNIKPIHLDYDPTFKPIQPPFHNTPIHYQPAVSDLLQFLREQGVITDVDPSDTHECVMNAVITDKKNGDIRMNIDCTPSNPGMNRTKFHVQTPQEIRHDLKEAKVFTELDMGWAFHQLPIDESTKRRSVFQTHEGLHRMEVLYFGPTASSGIFHNEIQKILQGLNGALNIHDNILVWGRTFAEHLENLIALLERCAEYGITLKRSKTNICRNKIKWFGRTFTSEGVTADSDKINAIMSQGKPEGTEEIRSFLMACQYNAKFLFDSHEVDESYEEITSPLRALLKKDVKFMWGPEQENAYHKLLALMESPATLRPYDPKLPTHFVADSSEVGIQCSIYQERVDGTWVPIDHTSRSLTAQEQDYSPIERESLAQSFGMDQFRYYLVGGTFTAWTDHEPLVGIYNNPQRRATKRIQSHRDQIIDLKYTMQHLPGKEMPCDYGSRHPYPIDTLSNAEKEKLGCDIGNQIYVRRIDIGNTPDAISIKDISAAASKDPTHQAIMKELRSGSKPSAKIPAGYKRVWQELSTIDGILHKGNKIVLPLSSKIHNGISLRSTALHIAHEGHPGITAMKQHLRARLWFPGMDEEVEKFVETCLPCQASTVTPQRDPLIPTSPPEQPWQKLATDHWGPTADGKYLLVVIDKLSRYPEVAVVNSTSADDNIEAFDNIFTRHGYCEDLISDGGPPFNGTGTHKLQQYFKWAGINHHPTQSAEDPEANGLAESFMKHCRKIWHTAVVEGRNPRAEINKHLLMVRSTPHPTTKKTPAEILFGRHIKTRLPMTNLSSIERPDIEEAIIADQASKEKQKQYKDNKSYVKPHDIVAGDTVLLKQKPQKHITPYDPEPYTVAEVHGHQITAKRGNQCKTRDAQKWKQVNIRTPLDFQQSRQNAIEQQLLNHYNDDAIDIGTSITNSNNRCFPTRHQPLQQPTTATTGSTTSEPASNSVSAPPTRTGENRRTNRQRRPPPHLEDYQR